MQYGKLKDVNPPDPVQSSFDEVMEAQQERERMINVAQGEYITAMLRARNTSHSAHEKTAQRSPL